MERSNPTCYKIRINEGVILVNYNTINFDVVTKVFHNLRKLYFYLFDF